MGLCSAPELSLDGDSELYNLFLFAFSPELSLQSAPKRRMIAPAEEHRASCATEIELQNRSSGVAWAMRLQSPICLLCPSPELYLQSPDSLAAEI